MKLLTSSILFIVITIAIPGEAFRILGIFPCHAPSHFAMYGRLMKGLAERGHRVDVVSHYPLRKAMPNYTDVVSLAGTRPDMVNNMTMETIRAFKGDISETHIIATELGTELCDLLNHPKLRNLIENPPKNPAYDLVITEIFGAHCYLAVGQHLKVPVVGLTSSLMYPWANDYVANPDNPAYIPNTFVDFDGRMNFWQRLMNTLSIIRMKWEFYQKTAEQDDAIKKYIGPHAPSVRDAERNVSLILVNSHYSVNGPRPFTTAVVEVGGLHIDEKEATLPKDLQMWLDDSRAGVVYISFGSMIKIESFPNETLTALYTSLEKLAPVRVLMKIAEPGELLPGLPSNVITHRWIPQLGVLKHKNVRAFMTHGGLMGTQEAIYFGVPMIGVPFFGDQGQNIMYYSQLNMAVTLDYRELTVDKSDAAFHAVLHDPSYMEAAKRISALFRDRPMSAIDTAVFWIEYVIRNGGANLRSPAMDLAWWQIALFDVYAFLFLSTSLVMCMIIVLFDKLRRGCYASNEKRTTESKKVK